MKTNRSDRSHSQSTATRPLSLELLETRELLSVNPLGNGSDAAALVANAETSNAVVDLGDLQTESDDLTFEANGFAKQYTMSWEAIDGAASYNVKISRDGGDTWITYAKPTDAFCTIKSIVPGNTYMFRVTGVQQGSLYPSGDALEGTIAPISIAASSVTYHADEPISIALTGSDDASATIQWFYVTEAGDVEISEAAGSLEYTPTSALYPIRVVATGTGASEGSNSDVTLLSVDTVSFDYDDTTRQASLSWVETSDAASYKVKISRDGGATWIDYYNTTKAEDPTVPTCTVNGLYAGRSYSFMIYALDDAGAKIGCSSATFAPISVSANVEEYAYGDTISATVKAHEDASYDVAWFYATDDGDVEIEAARGKLSYRSTAADYPIKIVATGKSLSAGATSVVTIQNAAHKLDAGVFEEYNTLNRNVPTSWKLVDGATSYRFLRSDNGTWKKAATIVVEDGAVTSKNAEVVDGRVVYTINMFNAGLTGTYKVVAVNASGATVDEQEFSYTNFGLELENDAYNVAGETITATTTPDTDATWQWYSSNDQGETWSLIDGATDASYTVSADEAANLTWYKLVATNVDTGAESVVYARPDALDAPQNVIYEVDEETNVMTFDFAAVDDATSYQIEYYLDDAENPVWLNLNGVVWTTNADGTITATHKNASNYANYEFRVRSVNETSWSEWIAPSESEISLVVTTAQDVVDPYDGLVSLREAVAYYAYMLAKGRLAEDDAITFDPEVFNSAENSVIYVNPSTSVTSTWSGVYTDLKVDGVINVTTDLRIDASEFADYDVVVDGTNTKTHMMYFAGDKTNVSVNGLTFQNGTESNQFNGGGALEVAEYVTSVFTDCQFLNNTATYSGGAVFLRAGNTTFDGCSFDGNVSKFGGGAIYVENDLKKSYFDGTGITDEEGNLLDGNYVTTEVSLVDTTITNNTAPKGAGVYAGYNGMTEVVPESTSFYRTDGSKPDSNTGYRIRLYLSGDTTISGNAATQTGGGILCYGNYMEVADNVVISDNTSGADAGGLVLARGAMLVGSGVTFENNSAATKGGAIWCQNGVVDLDDAAFVGNTSSSQGSAIYLNPSSSETPALLPTVTLTNSSFTENTAPKGGAIFSVGSTTQFNVVNLTDTTFTGNTITATDGDGGGAITSNATTIALDGCAFNENSVKATGTSTYGRGGAIYLKGKSTLTSVNSSFTGNKAQDQGGAIYTTGCAVSISGTTTESYFSGNTLTNANYSGGGAIAGTGATISIDGTEFNGNTISGAGTATRSRGGAIYAIGGSTLEVDNSSFVDNVAQEYGGAIFFTGSSRDSLLTVSETSFTGNQVTKGGNYAGGGAIATNIATTTVDGCDFVENVVTGAAASNTPCGGALYVWGDSSLEIVDSSFTKNEAQKYGGAVAINANAANKTLNATIDSTTFDSNRGTGDGVWIGSSSTNTSCNYAVKIDGSSFADTFSDADKSGYEQGYTKDGSISAAGVGASSTLAVSNTSIEGVAYGIVLSSTKTQSTLENVLVANSRNYAALSQGPTTLVNCTIVDNNGYGIWANKATSKIQVQNSIVWDNVTDLYAPDASATIVGDHSLTQSDATSGSGISGFWLAATDSASPFGADYTLDPDASLITLESGETVDLIDGGDNSFVTTGVDLAGNARVVKYDSALEEAIVDLGAYEVQTPAQENGDPDDSNGGGEPSTGGDSDGPTVPVSGEYADDGGWALLDEVFADFFEDDAFDD